MTETLEILEITPNVQLARYRNLFVAVWTGPITLPSLEIFAERFRDMVIAYGSGVGMLSIVDPRYGLPDEVVRAQAAHVMKQLGAAVHVGAWVIEGPGLRLVAVRALLTGMFSLARRRAPIRVFDQLGAAVSWLLGPLGRASEAEALSERIAELRRSPIFFG